MSAKRRFYLYVDGVCRGVTRAQDEESAKRAFIALLPVYPYSDRDRVQITDTERPLADDRATVGA